MGNEHVAYRWKCPICGKSSWGLLDLDRNAVREQAKNVLLAHIRSTSGGGHADERAYPPSFDPDGALDYIEVSGGVENVLSD